MQHLAARYALAIAFAACAGLAVYVISGAGFGWYVLEARAAYGVVASPPHWHQPTMLYPAILFALLMLSRACPAAVRS